MDIKDLKVGDVVYIREDLEVGKRYGSAYFTEYMKQGVQRIMSIDSAEEDFNIVSKTDSFRYHYTPEMVDWDKTRGLKINESWERINESWERINESWERIKKEIKGDGTFKEITQFGENKNETTRAITQSGEEITVKNSNEENDIEKTIIMLMLKAMGVTYGDVKKEVEKVKIKWVPSDNERYHFIDDELDIFSAFFNSDYFVSRNRIKIENCFKTREEAEGKREKILEKVKEILKEEE